MTFEDVPAMIDSITVQFPLTFSRAIANTTLTAANMACTNCTVQTIAVETDGLSATITVLASAYDRSVKVAIVDPTVVLDTYGQGRAQHHCDLGRGSACNAAGSHLRSVGQQRDATGF
jgi:hypothetical protein